MKNIAGFVLGFTLLFIPSKLISQSELIIYDGTLGIHSAIIRNDTAVIRSVIDKSPAQKAGLRYNDQIIQINDTVVSGRGITSGTTSQGSGNSYFLPRFSYIS